MLARLCRPQWRQPLLNPRTANFPLLYQTATGLRRIASTPAIDEVSENFSIGISFDTASTAPITGLCSKYSVSGKPESFAWKTSRLVWSIPQRYRSQIYAYLLDLASKHDSFMARTGCAITVGTELYPSAASLRKACVRAIILPITSPEIDLLNLEIRSQIHKIMAVECERHEISKILSWPVERKLCAGVFRTRARSPQRIKDVLHDIESAFPHGVGDIAASGVCLKDIGSSVDGVRLDGLALFPFRDRASLNGDVVEVHQAGVRGVQQEYPF